MPKYTKEGEMIEGKTILCIFELRPSFGIQKGTGRQTATITGNPAVATIKKVWKYKSGSK